MQQSINPSINCDIDTLVRKFGVSSIRGMYLFFAHAFSFLFFSFFSRAFPSLLGLERERHMLGVVEYLQQLGVQNVGRFVSRLPPVLGYDVSTNLAPKVRKGGGG